MKSKIALFLAVITFSSGALACRAADLEVVDQKCGVNVLEGSFVDRVCISTIAGTDVEVLRLRKTVANNETELQSDLLLPIIKEEGVNRPGPGNSRKTLTVLLPETDVVSLNKLALTEEVSAVTSTRTGLTRVKGGGNLLPFQADLKPVPQRRCGPSRR